MGEWLSAGIAVVTAIIAYIGGLATSKANANAINIKTFQDLVTQVQALSIDLKKAREESSLEIEKVRDDLDKLERKNIYLWQYVYALLEHLGRNEISPLNPPKELESDAKLMKLISDIHERTKK
jgi:glutamine synthetase type III